MGEEGSKAWRGTVEEYTTLQVPLSPVAIKSSPPVTVVAASRKQVSQVLGANHVSHSPHSRVGGPN